ncbi:MAG: hypothetical protein VKN13_04960 [Cyanobacteriota bacterium]|nr:hypothetical protein [Cyanobacteriota bacterium]
MAPLRPAPTSSGIYSLSRRSPFGSSSTTQVLPPISASKQAVQRIRRRRARGLNPGPSLKGGQLARQGVELAAEIIVLLLLGQDELPGLGGYDTKPFLQSRQEVHSSQIVSV